MTRPVAPPSLDGFTFVSTVGQGGFADVFLYEQASPRRRVAVKVLLSDAATGPERRQFEDEANVMAQLSGHPAIVTILQVGTARDGRPFLVMEYCPPPSLAGRLRGERISVPETLETMVQIAAAVETAHRSGVMHRDIKPPNILVNEYGMPKLTDFGIAATVSDQGGGHGFSVPWSPPEVFGDDPPVDPRSDVYSLGATTYSLLAGRSPFEVDGRDNGNAALMNRIERDEVRPLRRPDVPASLDRALARAMAKSARDRHPSALAFAQALQDVQVELGLPSTRTHVLDSQLGEADAVEQDDRTQIRPVRIIAPDEAAGTRLRPIVVPRDEVGRSGADVSDTTVARPAARATPVPDTMARGVSVAADRTDGGHFIAGETSSAPSEPLAPRQRGRVPLLVPAGAALLVVVAAVIAVLALRSGSGDDPTPSASTTVSAPAPEDVVGSAPPAVEGLRARAGNGRVVFTWTNPSPERGDAYVVRTGPGPDALSGDARPDGRTTVTVRADRGAVACIEVTTLRAGAASAPVQKCGVAR